MVQGAVHTVVVVHIVAEDIVATAYMAEAVVHIAASLVTVVVVLCID